MSQGCGEELVVSSLSARMADSWLSHVLGWGTCTLQGSSHIFGAFWGADFNNEPRQAYVRTQAHSRACHKW